MGVPSDSHANSTANDTSWVEQVQEQDLVDAMGRCGVYSGDMVVRRIDAQHRRQVPHGHGVMLYMTSKDVNDRMTPVVKYEGPWKDGHWHGTTGYVMMDSGDSYRGALESSQKCGPGTYCFADGRKFVGEFDRDHRVHGTFTWPEDKGGMVYKGEFNDKNQRHGQGVYKDPTQHITYVGLWQNGVYHGYGDYQWVDNAGHTHAYRGNFLGGKPHGHGIQVNPDGSVKHEGEWRFGKPVTAEQLQREWEQRSAAATNTAGSTERDQSRESFAADSAIVVCNQEWIDSRIGAKAVYRGLWDPQKKVPVGNGTAEFLHHDMSHYEGCFDEEGLFHGHGRLTWINGDSYEGNFEKGVRDGFGIYKWKDGRQYRGMFQKNMRHGEGVFLYANNDHYEGSFVNSKREGRGRFIFADGSLYEGNWKAGLYHGHGKLVENDGNTYTGEFENGVPHGQGKQVKPDGSIAYEGAWIRGEREDQVRKRQDEEDKANEAPDDQSHGETQAVTTSEENLALSLSGGKISDTDSADSSGDVVSDLEPRAPPPSSAPPPPPPPAESIAVTPNVQKGPECEAVVDQLVGDSQGNKGKYTGIVLKESRKPHGVGRMVYADGKRIHEGFWQNGSKEGHGRCLFFPQGDYHEGNYERNLRHGKGNYHWQDGRAYSGDYFNDLRHGEGTFRYPNGDIYHGGFVKGQRSGFGRFDFAAGFYEGMWLESKYHGHGKLVWGEGLMYEGEFQHGLMHGRGVKTDVAGNVLQDGEWVQGRFQSDNTTASPSRVELCGPAVPGDDSVHSRVSLEAADSPEVRLGKHSSSRHSLSQPTGPPDELEDRRCTSYGSSPVNSNQRSVDPDEEDPDLHNLRIDLSSVMVLE